MLLIECTFTLKHQIRKCHLCTRLAPQPQLLIISNLSMRQLLLISKRLSSVHGIILLSLLEHTLIKMLRDMNRSLLLPLTIWVMSSKLVTIIQNLLRHILYSQILFILELLMTMSLRVLLVILRNSRCLLSFMVSSNSKMNSWECIATTLMMIQTLLLIGSCLKSTSQLTSSTQLRIIVSIRTQSLTPRYPSRPTHSSYSIKISLSPFVSSTMSQCARVLTTQWLTLMWSHREEWIRHPLSLLMTWHTLGRHWTRYGTFLTTLSVSKKIW